MAKPLTIAIDGFSSCGKSTLAKALSAKLGYVFIDTGAMYRGVTLYLIEEGIISKERFAEEQINHELTSISIRFEKNTLTGKSELVLNDRNVENLIRLPHVAQLVSPVATVKAVRQKLVAEQREMGKNGGVIMDGRDIGSVVFPDAEVKLFITADPDVRAQRRFLELTEQGVDVTFEEIKDNLLQRDHIDSTRKESPLVQPDDAIVIDTTHLTPDEQLEKALLIIDQKLIRSRKKKSN
jgi:cytidylate kinase